MSILPQNKRREVGAIEQGIKIWLYAAPYVGKTTFADQFPDPINLNTDGNIKFVSMPYVTISPDSQKGKTAWEAFKATNDELLRGNHTYKTIVVDLLEDIYQYCRDHHNNAQGWVHESEPGFARGYDLILNDFLGELKRLATSGYNVIFLSHQVDKVVKSRTGKETTIFQPNLGEKVAIKVSGLVDITARAFMDVVEAEDGSTQDVRLIQMKPTANEFNSGGRIKTDQDTIELNYQAFMDAINVKSLDVDVKPEEPVEAPKKSRRAPKKQTEVTEEEVVSEIAEETMYFRHDASGELIKVEKGEQLPADFLHGGPELIEPISEKRYLELLKEEAEEAVEETTPRPRNPRRREKPAEEPAVEETKEEAAPRTRRTRRERPLN